MGRNYVLIVTSPSKLEGELHDDEVTVYCRLNDVVILMCFGDERYRFSKDFEAPNNLKILHYDYESVDDKVDELRDYLEGFGVGIFSRHHQEDNRLPFLITGSVIRTPENLDLNFK